MTRGWALLDLALLAATGWCLLAPPPTLLPTAAPSLARPPSIPLAPPALPTAPLSVADLSAHPLFSPTRLPTTLADPAATAAAGATSGTTLPTQPPPTLVGIIHDARESLALLRDPQTGQIERRRTHQRIAGLELLAIGPSSVRLGRDGTDDLTLDLHSTAKPSPPPPGNAVTPTPRRAARTAAR